MHECACACNPDVNVKWPSKSKCRWFLDDALLRENLKCLDLVHWVSYQWKHACLPPTPFLPSLHAHSVFYMYITVLYFYRVWDTPGQYYPMHCTNCYGSSRLRLTLYQNNIIVLMYVQYMGNVPCGDAFEHPRIYCTGTHVTHCDHQEVEYPAPTVGLVLDHCNHSLNKVKK